MLGIIASVSLAFAVDDMSKQTITLAGNEKPRQNISLSADSANPAADIKNPCDFAFLPNDFSRDASLQKAQQLDKYGACIISRLDRYLTTGEPVSAEAETKIALFSLKRFVGAHHNALTRIARGSDYYSYTQALVEKGIKTAESIRALYKFAYNRNGGAKEYQKRKQEIDDKLAWTSAEKARAVKRAAFKMEAKRKRAEDYIIRAFAGTGIKVKRVEIEQEWREYSLDANDQWQGKRVTPKNETPFRIQTNIGEIRALSKPGEGRMDFYEGETNRMLGSLGHATKKLLNWRKGEMTLPGDMSLSVLTAAERNGKGEVVKEHQIVAGVKEGPLSKGVRYLLKPINWVFCKAETAAGGIVNSVGGLIGGDFGATSREAAKASWEQFIGKKPDGNVNRNLAPGQAHHLLSSSWGHVSNIGLRLGTGFVIGAGLGRLFPARAGTGTNGVGRPAGEGINTSGVKGGFVDTKGEYGQILYPEVASGTAAPSAPLPHIFNVGIGKAATAPVTASPLLVPTTAGAGILGLLTEIVNEGEGPDAGGKVQYGYVGPSNVPYVHTSEGQMSVLDALAAGHIISVLDAVNNGEKKAIYDYLKSLEKAEIFYMLKDHYYRIPLEYNTDSEVKELFLVLTLYELQGPGFAKKLATNDGCIQDFTYLLDTPGWDAFLLDYAEQKSLPALIIYLAFLKVSEDKILPDNKVSECLVELLAMEEAWHIVGTDGLYDLKSMRQISNLKNMLKEANDILLRYGLPAISNEELKSSKIKQCREFIVENFLRMIDGSDLSEPIKETLRAQIRRMSPMNRHKLFSPVLMHILSMCKEYNLPFSVCH